jgi:hypothetical protein
MRSPADPLGEFDYVALEPDEPGRGRGRRSQPLIVGLAVLGVLVAAGVVISRPHSTATDPPVTTPSTVALTPEAPWDGKQSHRLPITVTPDTGLANNQLVTITGSGFPRGKQVAAVVCTIDAGSKGVDACDISTASSMAGTTTLVAADGTFTINYKIHSRIDVGGKQIDCATGNVDPQAYHQSVVEFGPLVRITTPGRFSCLVAVGAIDNYDQSGGALVAFAGETFHPFDVDGTPETTTTGPLTGTTPTSGDVPATTALPPAPNSPTTDIGPAEPSPTVTYAVDSNPPGTRSGRS